MVISAFGSLISKVNFMQLFSIYDLYYQWENVGVFDFLLPMILILSVIFGILTSTRVLGSNRGINFLISLSIALMAMRLTIVSEFFSLIFPGLGIGIAVLVVALVMVGLFISKGNFKDWIQYFFWGGLVVGLIIIIAVLNEFAWFGSYWWQANWLSVIWIIVLLAILAPLFMPKKEDDERRLDDARYVGGMPIGFIRSSQD